MKNHAFGIEIYRKQTRTATTKRGLQCETGVINQSGGKCKDDRQQTWMNKKSIYKC